ncbi:unnamed protein product [Dibothriocephalus latus]|uniref:Uncharacterized protein n=1 Tax=Dibothriocephalus latus TaxID=60516 RepID=A0A3P6PVM0_DIBLA|nr:unnamed protein product [Dibothriocephalus latus]
MLSGPIPDGNSSGRGSFGQIAFSVRDSFFAFHPPLSSIFFSQPPLKHGRHQEEDACHEDGKGECHGKVSFFSPASNRQIRAVNLENQLKEKANEFEKKEEEMNELQSKLKNAQTDVDTVQESLQEAIVKLEETDKRATNVSHPFLYIFLNIKSHTGIPKMRHRSASGELVTDTLEIKQLALSPVVVLHLFCKGKKYSKIMYHLIVGETEKTSFRAKA